MTLTNLHFFLRQQHAFLLRFLHKEMHIYLKTLTHSQISEVGKVRKSEQFGTNFVIH